MNRGSWTSDWVRPEIDWVAFYAQYSIPHSRAEQERWQQLGVRYLMRAGAPENALEIPNEIPNGYIIPWQGENVPDGWVEVDLAGRVVGGGP